MLNFFQQPAPRSGEMHRMRQHEKKEAALWSLL